MTTERRSLGLICCSITLVLTQWATAAHAQFPKGAFLAKHISNIKITSGAQAIYPGICSAPVTVRLRNFMGVNTNPSISIVVTLSSPDAVTVYTDPSCTTPANTVTVPTYLSTGTFYIAPTSTGVVTLTASASNYRSDVQVETASANPYVWTGGGGNANWSTNANWSGGTAPSSSKVAVFDSTCAANCSPNIIASVNVAGVRIFSGYTGTITQGAGQTITLSGTQGWWQSAGTFVGSAAAITSGGGFILDGGSFTSTSGTFAINSNASGVPLQVSGTGVFAANAGSVIFNIGGSANVSVGATSFNNFTFQNYGGYNLTGTFTVAGTLTMGGLYGPLYISGGTINALGDINLNSSYGGHGGSAVLNIAGSANQTISSTGSSNNRIVNLTVNSTGGTVALSGVLTIGGNYTFTSGTLSAGTSTLIFSPGNSNGSYTISPGTPTYNNITYSANCGYYTLSGTFKVSGLLKLGQGYSTGCYMNGGTFAALGNVTLTSLGMSGTSKISVVGSTNQTIDISGTTTGHTPNFEIASTGGTVGLAGNFFVDGAYKYTSGTIAAGTSTLTLNATATHTFGSPSYNNVAFTSSTTATLAGSLTASGNVTINSSATVNLPNPGTTYSLTTGGALTLGTSSNLWLYGGSHSEGTLSNSGTIHP